MDDFAVQFEEVNKKFVTPEGTTVIAADNINIKIEKGEFFSLLGSSGCGKSTCLKMIAGFERPNSGRIYINGRWIKNTPPHKRSVNTVFQNYALFTHMNTFDNVAFGLKMEGVSKKEIKIRVHEALELVNLLDQVKRRPHQLSGGQQQRVALARAIVKKPTVLLLDEPLGALDLKLRQSMQLELKNLQTELGISFVFVTHDQEEALTMSDRIGVMDHGIIHQVDTPLHLYERPKNLFVAKFIGETNVLNGVCREVNSEMTTVFVPTINQTIEVVSAPELKLGDECDLVIRPEKIVLHEEKPDSIKQVFPAKVIKTLYIGSDSRVSVIMGKTPITVWEQNNISDPNPSSQYIQNEQTWVELNPKNVYALPAQK